MRISPIYSIVTVIALVFPSEAPGQQPAVSVASTDVSDSLFLSSKERPFDRQVVAGIGTSGSDLLSIAISESSLSDAGLPTALSCESSVPTASCGCHPNLSCGCSPACLVKVAPYFWLLEMHGSTTIRGVTQDVHVSTRDLLDLLEHNVHFAASGRAEVQRGRWSVLFDGYYVKAGLANQLEFLDFSSQFEDAIIELAVAYQLDGVPEMLSLPPCSRFELLAGGRYHMLKGGLTITGPLGRSATAAGERQWVDPIVGGRLAMPLNQWTSMQVRGDIGGFEWGTASDFTWNVEAVIECRCTPGCTLTAGYRVLDVDNQRHSGDQRFAFDIQYRGPIAAIAFEF